MIEMILNSGIKNALNHYILILTIIISTIIERLTTKMCKL